MAVSNVAAPNNEESGTPKAPRTPTPKNKAGGTNGKAGSAKKVERAVSEGSERIVSDLGTGDEGDLEEYLELGEQTEMFGELGAEAGTVE